MQKPKSVVRCLPPNWVGRDFYIGDLHGCVGLLHRLLRHVDFDDRIDRVISVGDLVDRGEHSFAATALIDTPWFHAVLGNHELMSLGALGIPPYTMWAYELRYGDHRRWHQYLTEDEKELVARRLASLPLALEIEQPDGRVFGVIHAQVEPQPGWSVLHELGPDDLGPYCQRFGKVVHSAVLGREIHELMVETLGLAPHLWGNKWLSRCQHQNKDRSRRTEGIDLLIYGHVITSDFKPFAVSNRLAIETGAFVTDRGRLSLVEPLTGRYWQVGGTRGLDTRSLAVTSGELPEPHTTEDICESLEKRIA